jgi:hypothetical protein
MSRICACLVLIGFLVPPSILAQQALPGADDLSPGPKPPRLRDCDEYAMNLDTSFTVKQRLCYFGYQFVSPESFAGAAFFGGMSQWKDDPPEWGQNKGAYFKRAGVDLLQSSTKSFTQDVSNLLLKEDPRTYPSHQSGVLRRGKFALLNSITAYRLGCSPSSIQCKRHISPSWVAGAFAGGFIGNLFYPDSSANTASALTRTATGFAGTLGSDLFKEFSPDIANLFSYLTGNRHAKPDVPEAPPPLSAAPPELNTAPTNGDDSNAKN